MITRALHRAVWRTDRASTVQRIDRFELRLDRATIEEPENQPGVIDVWGVATRSGVFVYDEHDLPELKPGQLFREWRPPDEVFDKASLASLVGVPFTIDHPTEPVTSANWQDLAHGTVLEVKVDGTVVLAKIRISTDLAKASIKSGTVELSCGYSARLEEIRGVTPGGEVYDGIQRDIRYNHLALVDLARAGHVARLHLDSGARVQRLDQARKRGPQPMKITIDGKTYDLPALLQPGFTQIADETARAVRRGDAIETSAVTFQDPDGGGSVKLVLPKGTVEEMLGMIGATGGAPAPAPAGDELNEPEDELGAMGGLEGSEGGDELEDGGDEDEGKRMDAAAITKIVNDAVAKAVGAQVPAVLQAREDRARERSELERTCSPHLESGYRFDQASDLEVIVDTVETLAPERLDSAKALAKAAKGGDMRARGRLDALLEHLTESDRVEHDDSGEVLGAVFSLRTEQGEANELAQRGDSRSVPRHVKARQDRIARLEGKKTAG